MRYDVVFTVRYWAEIEADSQEELWDRISDIDIPENESAEYLPLSFDVYSVSDETGKKIEN
jgi:hypothetical protein